MSYFSIIMYLLCAILIYDLLLGYNLFVYGTYLNDIIDPEYILGGIIVTLFIIHNKFIK